MSIEFEGLDEVLRKFATMRTEDFQKHMKKACLVVEREAKKKAPKGKTGELARSITSKVEGREGIIFTPLHYAPYVEYGTGLYAEEGGRTDVPWYYEDAEGEWHATSGMHPRPYMRPALIESREKVKEVFKEGLLKK